MATAPRVRLSSLVTEGSGAGSGAGSRWQSEREGDEAVGSTLRLGSREADFGFDGSVASTFEGDTEVMRTFLARLEASQAQQRSPQQPNPELDDELARALSMHPSWRTRMAVATRSPLLRKKILSCQCNRAVGSSALGQTHPWRKDQGGKHFSDHSWPKAQLGDTGLHLPGGDARHDLLLRANQDQLAKHPLQSNTANHSFMKTKRFPGTGNYEVDTCDSQKRSTPGPGAYFKTVPRGTAFSMDGGETVILGANHVCPWKKSLGRNINPVHVDGSTLRSQPCFSFSRTIRSVSEVSLGTASDPGPTKSDRGCLSPGPVYAHYGTFGPAPACKPQRRARSTTSAPKVRMIPVRFQEEEVERGPEYIMDCDDSSMY